MFNLDSALGVEIQNNRLAMASVKKAFGKFTVRSHLVIDGYLDVPRVDLLSRVRQFVKSNGFNQESITVGIPRDQVVVREIELPIEVEENLEEVVRLQIDKLEPSEEEASFCDFQMIDRDEKAGRVLIQVIMAKRAYVEEVLSLFREFELFPASIKYSGVGLGNILKAHADGYAEKNPVLVVRIDSEKAELLVVTDKQQLFSETTRIPAASVTVDWLVEEISDLISRIPEPLDSFSGLYLLGDSSSAVIDELRQRIPDAELLTSKLSLKHKGISKSELGELAAPIGLAISCFSRKKSSKVNLIPPDLRVVEARTTVVPTFALGALLILMLGGLVTRDYFQGRDLAVQIEGTVRSLEGQVGEVFDLRDRVEQRKAELLELQDLLEDRQQTLLLLRDLTDRIPDDTYLQNLQIQGQQVTLQGYSEQASRLPPLLLESPLLENVKTNWISQDPRNAGKERFNMAANIVEK
jgi:Tfp pilus assembly protein PilN